MRLLAFDMKDNGNWRKQWDSLATGFTVFTCNVSDERESGMNAIRTTINGGQKILVLIHQERADPGSHTGGRTKSLPDCTLCMCMGVAVR